MPVETREKTIGSHVYRVTQLGAIKGRAVLLRLARPIGAAVGTGTMNVGAALRELSEDDLAFVSDTFADATKVVISDGENAPKSLPLRALFDDHFAGRYSAMLEWLGFAVEVNFADFFADLVAKVPRRGPAADLSSSPATSTGSSGASSPLSS